MAIDLKLTFEEEKLQQKRTDEFINTWHPDWDEAKEVWENMANRMWRELTIQHRKKKSPAECWFEACAWATERLLEVYPHLRRCP